MSPVDLVVLALATWRLTSLLIYERGPGAIFQKGREKVGIEHNEDSEPCAWPDTEVGYLLRCLACGSLWIGLGLVGLYLLSERLAIILALPFAASAGAVIIERLVRGENG